MTQKENLLETVIDGTAYVCPTWEQMGHYTFTLAQQILKSGRQFDRIVALAKGGWTWARAMASYLQIDKLSSTRFKSYNGINQSGQIRILQPLTDFIDGEKILIFDDVNDSGETMAKAREYLAVLGGKDIATAVFCYKPRSRFVPEFYSFSTKAWVVFPHEYREFIDLSYDQWSAKNISFAEIKSRLLKIGLPKDEIDYFLSLK